MRLPRSRVARASLVAAASFFAADQVLQHTVLADGILRGRRIAPFDPPLFTDLQQRLLAQQRGWLDDPDLFRRRSDFDPDLGWCPRPGWEGLAMRYDWAGARVARTPLPDPIPPDVPLVVAVGDSFTRGDEVGGGETWLAALEERESERLWANLGVGGFGLDQVYLRLGRDGLPLGPEEVWLAFFPGSALRVTSHFPPVSFHRSLTVLFKPNVRLGPAGELVHLPSPVRGPEDVRRLFDDQRAFLAAAGPRDFWIRRLPAAYAPRGSSWTHAFAATRLTLTWLDGRDRDVARWLQDRESEVFRLHRTLILAARADAQAAGARFRLLVLPGRRELGWIREHGRGYWQSLADALVAEGVEVLDVSAALEAAGGDADELWMPGGHYSPRANRAVADAVREAWCSR